MGLLKDRLVLAVDTTRSSSQLHTTAYRIVLHQGARMHFD